MPDRPLVRRRTAVAGALGGLAVTVVGAGCDTGDDLVPPDGSPSPSTSSPSTEPDQRSPDQVLVDAVLTELTVALDVLASARKFRSLRTPLASLARAHRRHVEVLGIADEDATTSEVPANAAAALLAVRHSERQLHVSLVGSAERAESGALARLLASMSASVTQHLSLLPAEVAP